MKYIKMVLWVGFFLVLYLAVAVVVSLILGIDFFGYSIIRYGFNESIIDRVSDFSQSQANTTLIIANFITTGLIFLITNARRQNISEHLWVNRPKSRFITPVILAGISASFIVPTLMYIIDKVFSLQKYMEEYNKLMESLEAGNPVINAIAIAIAAPLLEEFMFRGAIYKELRRLLPVWSAIIIQAALFGIYHMNLIQGIYAFGVGIILGLVYEWTKSIWMPIALHASFNSIGLFQDYLPLKNDKVYLGVIIISVLLLVYSLYRTNYLHRRYRI